MYYLAAFPYDISQSKTSQIWVKPDHCFSSAPAVWFFYLDHQNLLQLLSLYIYIHTPYIYMGDSLEKGTKTVTRSSVAMRTPEIIACFTRPQLSGISVKLVQCDQIYESPTLNKTLGTYLNGYNNHRHYIFRVICIQNLLRVQIKWRNTRSSLWRHRTDTSFENIVVVAGYSRNAKNRCSS